jgi:oxaloacetate decarboxylase alpha subunit/pyruvate carboxylase subunit B
MLEPRMPKLRAELAQKGIPADDEHCVIYAMFPHELEKLYQAPNAKTVAPAAVPAVATASHQEARVPEPAHPVGHSMDKKVSHLALTIDGTRHQVSVEEMT